MKGFLQLMHENKEIKRRMTKKRMKTHSTPTPKTTQLKHSCSTNSITGGGHGSIRREPRVGITALVIITAAAIVPERHAPAG